MCLNIYDVILNKKKFARKTPVVPWKTCCMQCLLLSGYNCINALFGGNGKPATNTYIIVCVSLFNNFFWCIHTLFCYFAQNLNSIVMDIGRLSIILALYRC